MIMEYGYEICPQNFMTANPYHNRIVEVLD